MATDPGLRRVTLGPEDPELAFVATSSVRAVLGRIGRTEDVRFSPDNRRLAITAFHEHLVVLVDVEIAAGHRGPTVVLSAAVECPAPGLAAPHGVDFLDDDTIVVANRHGGVTVHRCPARGTRSGLAPMDTLFDDHLDGIVQPGSVRVARGPAGDLGVLVCDNLAHTVTHHPVTIGPAGPVLGPARVRLRRWLDVPDSLATSADGRWLAVSNHETQSVLVYDTDPGLDEHSEPVAVLRGVVYPHGLAFTPDARHLVVADAGRPHLHVYAAGDDRWWGSAYPVASHRVMDDTTFLRGRDNPQEGGPKGLDLDRSGRVVVVTSVEQPLAFFDLDPLIATVGEADAARRLDYDRETLDHAATRRAFLADANARAAEAEHRAAAATRRAEAAEQRAVAAEQAARATADAAARERAALVDAYERTKIMRLSRPARRLYGAWRVRRRPPEEHPR